jgi:putative membrane-bound dehydrogenase-like protein
MVIIATLVYLPNAAAQPPQGEAIRALFLGDNGPHQPRQRAYQLMPALWKRGIHTTYTDNLDDLNPETLAQFDCLIIYANHEEINPAQEEALLDYVAKGGGFVPLHCASYCFLNSPKYIELVGAQFITHGEGVFTATIDNADHQSTEGLEEFATWDETYVHTKHNPDREILMTRVDEEGAEPWTWTRTHGEGRVFYTAYGHDHRTFSKPGFHQLIEQGIRWATDNENVARTAPDTFEYREENIAFYPPEGERGGIREAPKEMQLPVSPAESVKHMEVQPGINIELFASEPDVFKPIALTWDERGRLWIAETRDYPNDMQRPGDGNDQIKICEDTDGDGVADKFTIFADNLSIPTSIIHANGGLVVLQAPDTLLLKDTDGDDKADTREVLFTGWGTFDTHAGPSNLRMGLDNWLWATAGYSGFDGEVGGEQHRFEMGVVRFKSDGSKLEFVSPTSNNTWGLGFSETGEVFGSTANEDHSFYTAFPNRYFERVRGWSGRGTIRIRDHEEIHPITDRVRQVDVHGGFTAAAGSALYTARAYPKEYWNAAAFVTEPTGHLIHTCFLERQGTNFESHDGWNLLASDDEWTSPIIAEVGPDGAVWSVDWYNYIVQHNPTPQSFTTGKGGAYETDVRDKNHGRIYRLVHESAGGDPPLRLDDALPGELVAALAHDNMFWRLTAQRLLVDRGEKDVVGILVDLIENQDLDAIGNNPGALHALATLDGLGVLDGSSGNSTEILHLAMNHTAPAVRRRALAIAPAAGIATDQYIARLSDADARVRMEALLALSEDTSHGDAGAAIAALLSDATAMDDRWIPTAITAAAAQHDVSFLTALASEGISGDETSSEITRAVAEHYARGGEDDSLESVLVALSTGDTAVANAALDGLTDGWPEGNTPNSTQRINDALIALSEKVATERLGAVVTFARQIGQGDVLKDKVASLLNAKLATINDSSLPDDARIDAAQKAIALRIGSDAQEAAVALLTPQASPELVDGILGALAQSESPETAEAILQRFDALLPAGRSAAVDVLLARIGWTNAFLDKIEDNEILLPTLSVIQSRRLIEYPNRRVRRRARTILAANDSPIDADRKQLVDSMMHLASTTGDPVLGKTAFEENCSACHTFNGEGGEGAPVLTGVFGGNREEILIAVIDPNRSVEGNFRAWNVEMQDGRILSGLVSDESKTSFTIQDTLGARHTILREDVYEMSMSPLSVMPEGFESLEQDQLAGLLAYLTTTGAFQPLDITTAANTVSSRPMFTDGSEHADDPFNEAMVFPSWGFFEHDGIPFQILSPKLGATPNFIMLHSPQSERVEELPKSASVPCNSQAIAMHLLSGVSGWGFPFSDEGTHTMTVRLHYADGTTEDHKLINGIHFADYVHEHDVPKSQLVITLPPHDHQMRYLSIEPKKEAPIETIEFIKGEDNTAPIIAAVTIETPGEGH